MQAYVSSRRKPSHICNLPPWMISRAPPRSKVKLQEFTTAKKHLQEMWKITTIMRGKGRPQY